jgi:hypothetical protein
MAAVVKEDEIDFSEAAYVDELFIDINMGIHKSTDLRDHIRGFETQTLNHALFS